MFPTLFQRGEECNITNTGAVQAGSSAFASREVSQADLGSFHSVPSWGNDPCLRKSVLSWIVAPQQASLYRGKVHQKWESSLGWCVVWFFVWFFVFVFFFSLLCDLWEKTLLLMSSALLCPSEPAGALNVGWSHSRTELWVWIKQINLPCNYRDFPPAAAAEGARQHLLGPLWAVTRMQCCTFCLFGLPDVCNSNKSSALTNPDF